jgi:hypothetical protein
VSGYVRSTARGIGMTVIFRLLNSMGRSRGSRRTITRRTWPDRGPKRNHGRQITVAGRKNRRQRGPAGFILDWGKFGRIVQSSILRYILRPCFTALKL